MSDRLAKQIDKALARFTESIPAEPNGLYEPVRYFLSLGGKRLRPWLVLAAHELFDRDTKKALPAAIAIELFHNFTLIHDDIMDQAALRRKKATVHTRWDVNTAILSGDVMLVHSYRMLQQLPPRHLADALSSFNKAAEVVCQGQQLDMDFEKVSSVSLPLYLRMIRFKTAELLGAALKMGAQVGGARESDARALYELGINLGIAFQLKDDLLDVYGDSRKFGKQPGGDILANKKTFLYLKALSLADHKTKKELTGWFSTRNRSAEKVKAVIALFDGLNIRVHTTREIERHYKKAISSLQRIRVPEHRKQALAMFAEKLMAREN